jgi:Zinc-finger domain of monoamine-oxidase A repressor R1
LCFFCVFFRYPECEFDADDEEYSCPVCEGFCNCSICSRKRGEAYVGMRTCDKFTPPPQRPPRVKLGAKTNLPPPSSSSLPKSLPRTTIKTTTIPKGATNAWGSLYSVTGEKIGACFFDPSAAEKNNGSIVFAPATAPIMTTMVEVAQQVVATAAPATSEEPTTKIRVKKKRSKKKFRRRIFIGVVQDCWGYTKPKIKQLEAEPYSKRSYNSMPRYYIGKKKYLFYPVVEDDESSLTAMDDSDEVQELDGGDVEGLFFVAFEVPFSHFL